MPSTVTRILIADDHPLVRGALAQAVAGAAPGAEILEAGDLEGVTRIFSEGADIDLTSMSETSAARWVSTGSPTMRMS